MKQLFWFFIFGFSIIYSFIYLSFKYIYKQQCLGEWGEKNPSLLIKTGYGKCELLFEFYFRPTKKLLLKWKSYYGFYY